MYLLIKKVKKLKVNDVESKLNTIEKLNSSLVRSSLNVKITGSALFTYFDVKNEKFVNNVELKKDEEDSLIFTDEESQLFGFTTPRNSLRQPNSHSTPSEPKIANVRYRF